ncbi:hypothetical protein EGT74_15385 [Chitinophaga lutea]|uniref:Uncharacterized protein n=1 Tax=Chitinophaga lutea TaxID=2488634 RepID=A0A3N4PXN7_9BACT|nr:hypothetical protein [Chitinophaga lutea]RPE08430.1 hypothetical protein EGT74_15385 [Chitinophaga lutea]
MKKIFSFIPFVLIAIQSMAQQTETLILSSPDAAALSKYGNVPVSLYSGVPQIKVPPFNGACRDIVIPLELSYHGAHIECQSGNTLK